MKSNYTVSPLVAILFLGWLLFTQPSAGWAEPADFVVFYSGNVFGEMEACGG